MCWNVKSMIYWQPFQTKFAILFHIWRKRGRYHFLRTEWGKLSNSGFCFKFQYPHAYLSNEENFMWYVSFSSKCFHFTSLLAVAFNHTEIIIRSSCGDKKHLSDILIKVRSRNQSLTFSVYLHNLFSRYWMSVWCSLYMYMDQTL